MLELNDPAPVLGYDDFIYGKGESGECYITHIKVPRFVALISVSDLKPCLQEITWWDERPFGVAFDHLLTRAITVVETIVAEGENDLTQKIKQAVDLLEERFNIELHTLRDSEERMEAQAQEMVGLAEEQQFNIEKRKAAELALILSEEQLKIQISELRDSEERMELQAQELVALAEDLQAAEQEMKFLALHDALTKLPSRRLCMDRLEQAMMNDRRNKTKTAVLFIDLDGFKVVNDSLGHEAGDAVLIGVGQRLKALIRENDTVARIGGDEFVVLLNEAGQREDVALIAQEIVAELSVPFLIKNDKIKVGASIGIAISPDDGGSAKAVIRNADQSMYLIKRQGKNNYGFFSK
ncbi:diguanylate cyclase domain-containing protein [Kiloniella antarctica]|uniref:Diguanylate cyclase domain-containing protein n=1 Tax=Kiloniella antarctica TaxID=1550907 RepID=A0ABW5BER5_9PROT